MKNFIKQLLGDSTVFRLRELKNKIIPGETRKMELREMERCRIFYSRFVKAGDLCFDIGANMGNKVQPLLDLNASVVAVEPQSFCRKVLKYRFGNRIKIVAAGAGAKKEIREFYKSNASTISSFSREWIDEVSKQRFKDYSWNEVEQVSMTTLDSLIEEFGAPSFIKIDVEGFEQEVLKGLSKPVSIISYEYTVPEQTQNAISCLELIRTTNPAVECNYSVTEKMEFALKKWLTADEMIKHISGDEFRNTGNGDIYVKNRSLNIIPFTN